MPHPQQELSPPKKSTTVRFSAALLRGLAAVAPEAAAAGLVAAFRHSRRHPVPERERRWLAAARRGAVEVEGRLLPTWTWGSGPAVLLVHGWQGRGSQMGAFAAPLADAGFRAVAWDAPGHGASAGRLSSLPEMIAAVAAAAGQSGPVAGIVAHSVGAAAASGALAAGLEVERAVFLAPPAEPARYLAAAGAWLGLPPAVAERARRRIERRFAIDMDALAPVAQAPRMATPHRLPRRGRPRGALGGRLAPRSRLARRPPRHHPRPRAPPPSPPPGDRRPGARLPHRRYAG